MACSTSHSSLSGTLGLAFVLAISAVPGQAEPAPQSRLVHCGGGTCLRLSGQRLRSETAIRIGGTDLAVEGGRAWRATVPLETARTWPVSPEGLTLTFADAQAGTERRQTVALPPGALGRRIQLAALVVSAR